MSYVVYGSNNDKKVIKANSIEEAYNKFVTMINEWHYKNVNYKIERLY